MMWKIAVALALVAGPVLGQDLTSESSIKERLLKCFEAAPENDDGIRLKCYDDLAADVPELASTNAPTSPNCEIDGWAFRHSRQHTFIDGSTTCQEGKINMRFFNEAEDVYLGSVVAYVDGYAFQTITQLVEQPSKIMLRYTFDPD